MVPPRHLASSSRARWYAVRLSMAPRRLTRAEDARKFFACQHMHHLAYIALGSNLGDRDQLLARARSALAALPRSRVVAESSVEETARVRTVHWGPRTLDLDIVRFGDRHVDEPDLVIPHPQLSHRDWWKRELAELGATECA